jgi:hypothetical protein
MVSVIGNCQIAPLRSLLKGLGNAITIISLPAVHTMTSAHEHMVQAALEQSDLIFGQYITDDYPIQFVRTSFLRNCMLNKLIVWPNLYFNAYAPEYNTLRDASFFNFRGPLLDYHSDKILWAYARGLSVTATVRLLDQPSEVDALWYGQALEKSLSSLRERETLCDVAISDFIEEHFSRHRLFHIMNHPSIFLLSELSNRLSSLSGIRLEQRVPPELFADLELVTAIHPDNAYIRELHQFTFPKLSHYRGVEMIPDGSILGASAGALKAYSHTNLVEAMFKFYEPHKDRILAHSRVRDLLSRPGEV